MNPFNNDVQDPHLQIARLAQFHLKDSNNQL